MQASNVVHMPWLKPVVDTTEIMAKAKTHFAIVAAEEAKKTAGRIKLHVREIDESLLDIEAMEALMLPFCREPYGHPIRKLAKLSVMFLRSPHYKTAVNLMWRDIDLFGVSPTNLRDSRPAGLLPSLAWTAFRGKLRGIDREGAKIIILRPDGTTSAMQMWRPHPCPGTVPFWESKALGGVLQ